MKILWLPHEIEYLQQHYAENLTPDIAHTLRRTTTSVAQKARKMGLKKSTALIAYTGTLSANHPNTIASRIKPGTIPPNKGQKMPDSVREKCSVTFFKKGNQPHNTRREGDGALCKRHNGYWYIRIRLGRWRQLHTTLWEKENRPIDPKTEMVKFRDGNKDNLSPENLYLCTRAENMRENTIHRYPAEIKTAISAITSLKRQIKKHAKQ